MNARAPYQMEPRKASPAKDGPSGFMSEERVDDEIMKEEKAFFGAVRPTSPSSNTPRCRAPTRCC